MSQDHVELNARVNDCIVQARQAMELAIKTTEEASRFEYLTAALEWLKLATELRGI